MISNDSPENYSKNHRKEFDYDKGEIEDIKGDLLGYDKGEIEDIKGDLLTKNKTNSTDRNKDTGPDTSYDIGDVE